MNARSIQSTTAEGLKQELVKAISKDFIPSLAVVFISMSHNAEEIANIFSEHNIKVYGATTNGAFIDENIIEKPISVLLMNPNFDQFEIFTREYDPADPKDKAADIANRAKISFKNPAFLIAASNLATNSEELLRGFQEVIGDNVILYGGMAGDDFAFQDSHVFSNDFKSYQGIVAIAFDGDVFEIKGTPICGWKPVGIERTVTKSEGNRVYEIDGLTALEITKKFSGLENFTKENENINLEVAVNFPFQLLKHDGESVMRPGLVINWEDGSFECSGMVPQGSKIKFSLPPDFSIIEEVIEGNRQFKESSMPNADALIIYSCAGRLMAFGPLMSEEVEGVRNIWQVPMAGFFSSAELARVKGGNLEMHNFTTCCVAIKEHSQ